MDRAHCVCPSHSRVAGACANVATEAVLRRCVGVCLYSMTRNLKVILLDAIAESKIRFFTGAYGMGLRIKAGPSAQWVGGICESRRSL